MNTESILALFKLVGPQDLLYVTLLLPQGGEWQPNQQCQVVPPVGIDPSQLENSDMIAIVPITQNGYYTNFPVETVSNTASGQVVLKGPKGTAVFTVVRGK